MSVAHTAPEGGAEALLGFVRTMNPPNHRRSRLFALLLSCATLGASGCASLHRDTSASRRAEEAVERSTVVPRVTPPPPREPAPPPAPVRRVAPQWPAASMPGALARPLSELASAPGAGGAGRSREVVRAIEIHFAAGAAELDARARALLEPFAARLNLADAPYVLEVQGHSDSTGTTATNIALGLRRAEAVRRYLLAATTIPRERIGVVSLGAGQPAADDASEAGRAANRRVVVLALR